MSGEFLDVIAIGETVCVGGDVNAIITGICVRESNHITYECTWWGGNTRNCQWLESCEVTPPKSPKRIGLAHYAMQAGGEK